MDLRISTPLALVLMLVTAQAGAAGFEKSIMFGGRAAGVAGIATPYVQGSEALYYNPAGMLVDKGMQDVSVNLSPTFPKFTAPLTGVNQESSTKSATVFPLALMYARNINESLAFGIGYYTSGGSYADFQNVKFAGIPYTGEAKTDLAINEISLGMAYRFSPNFKLGVSYRAVMAQANFKYFQAVPGGGGVQNTALNNLKGTSYTGFKAGAQWKFSDAWNFGFTYRSNVPFTAKGTQKSQLMTASSNIASQDTSVKVSSTLPDAYTLGAEYKATDNWHLFGEVEWISYSRVKNLMVKSDAGNYAIPLGFKDEQTVRVAGEYSGLGAMPLRIGYIYTSRVSDAAKAVAGFVPPSSANTFTLGTGYGFNEMINVNGALEYSYASGGGRNPYDGKYTVNEYAIHLGADFMF